MKIDPRGMPIMMRSFGWAALLACLLPLAAAAQQGAQITPNYKDADLGQVIEAVSQVTGKSFIVDPRVRAQVTMLSTSPMSPEAFYEAFLAILQVHGYIAVPSGSVIKIMPDATARQVPANDLPDRVSSTSDEIVTQVVQVRNVSAGQLVPILRPMMPQSAHLAAYPSANMLIISDRAANVSRIVRIVQRIDRTGDGDLDVIRLEHASATEIVRVINSLSSAQGAEAAGAARIVADERTNSILLSGEQSQRLRYRTLITHLDTPLEAGGDTQVRYLRYADAEKLAAKLKEQSGAAVAAAGGAAAAVAAAAPGGVDKSVTIWAEPETNALVITAPPKTMRSLMSVVDRLDVRRAQVIIEALLVEVSTDAARDLGVNWIVDGSGDNFLVGLFNTPIAGVDIGDIAAAIDDPSSVTAAPGGLTIGGGRRQDSGTNFGAILRALASEGDTNIVSMPSVITLDNEEAQIKVAQEVPFLTGSYSNTGAGGGTGGGVNPFQTIERKEVGNILKITPQITDENTILLKIEQEASSIAAAAAQVSTTDLVTNKRTITTRVLVDDGGMIVLGGLIEDRLTESESRVPLLGKIPVIGALFRVRSTQKTKTNLMVFIRPRVLRTAEQAAVETNAKYNYLRDMQLGLKDGKVQLMPGTGRPTLPPLVGPTPPPTASEVAPASGPAATAPAGTAPTDDESPPELAEPPINPPQ